MLILNQISDSKKGPQNKLTIGQPDDQYGNEADTTADQVMQMNNIIAPPIQRKCEDCEEEALQMSPINQSTEPLIQRVPQDVTVTAPAPTSLAQPCDRTLPPDEVARRNVIFNDFTRGIRSINHSFRRVINSSMCDFSLSQLSAMKEAGLRFWTGANVPTIFEGVVERDTQQGSASYAREIRTIFLGDRVNPGYLTHEMAHAWDHIRNLPRGLRVRLDDVSDEGRDRIIGNPGQLLSETDQSQTIVDGTNMTFAEMHAAYVSRVPRTELAFRRGARRGYSRTDPQEFYAEGYSVFHGSSVLEHARLYQYARELYIFLNNEAQAEQMPTPDLAAVRAEARRLPRPR